MELCPKHQCLQTDQCPVCQACTACNLVLSQRALNEHLRDYREELGTTLVANTKLATLLLHAIELVEKATSMFNMATNITKDEHYQELIDWKKSGEHN